MSFQISAIPERRFTHLYGASDAVLAEHGVTRIRVEESPGYPCRVSLRDAEVGETVLLMNWVHHDAPSAYRASHAIFVIEGAAEGKPAIGAVPEMMRHRLLSVRAFNAAHDMIAADVCEGTDLEATIADLRQQEGAAYLHIHNAKPGCFAARVDWVTD